MSAWEAAERALWRRSSCSLERLNTKGMAAIALIGLSACGAGAAGSGTAPAGTEASGGMTASGGTSPFGGMTTTSGTMGPSGGSGFSAAGSGGASEPTQGGSGGVLGNASGGEGPGGSTSGSPTTSDPPAAGTVVIDGESRASTSTRCSASECGVGGYYISARAGADNEPGAFGVAVAFKSNPNTQKYAVQARPQPYCDANSVPKWSATEATLQVWVVTNDRQRVFYNTTAASSGTITATAYEGPGSPDSAAFAGVSVFDSMGNEKVVSANIVCTY